MTSFGVAADTDSKKNSPFGVACLPPSFRFSALAVASSTGSRSCGLLGEEAIVAFCEEESGERERAKKNKKGERESSDFDFFFFFFFNFFNIQPFPAFFSLNFSTTISATLFPETGPFKIPQHECPPQTKRLSAPRASPMIGRPLPP